MEKSTSNFVPIDNFWGLVEYTYNSDKLPLSKYGFMRIKNFDTQELLYLSNPVDLEDYFEVIRTTNNCFDNNSLRKGSVKTNGITTTNLDEYTYFDIETPISYYESINPNWLFENLNDILKSKNSEHQIEYDSLKIHILKGYNFEYKNGFVAKIEYVDKEGNNIIVSNNVYIKQDVLKYHSKPLRLADKLYDRYYEIKIPKIGSLKLIHDETNENLIESYNEKGIDYSRIQTKFPNISNASVNITIYNINNISYDQYNLRILDLELKNSDLDNSTAQISLKDEFESIAAFIKESHFGDYFEYYATYNNGFISDWLAENPAYKDSEFVLYHTIAIYEHYDDVNFNEKVNQYFTVEQIDNFDEPFYFRPVILDERTKYFTIEYYLRMVDINAVCPSQIIRKSSITYPNARKYGRFLERLNINENLSNFKIINKLISNNTSKKSDYSLNMDVVTNNTFNINPLKSEFLMPVNFNNINISQTNLILNEDNTLGINTSKGKTLYAQNNLNLELTPFDNYIVFDIYNKIDTGNVSKYNINRNVNFEYYIVFDKLDGSKYKIKAKDISENNIFLADGRLVFNIISEDILKIKPGYFWIIMVNNIDKIVGNSTYKLKNFENVIYSGKLKIEGRE